MLLKSLIERNGMENFRELHAWSVKNTELFWSQAWDDLSIVGQKGSLVRSGANFTGTKWFEEAKLNVVETLLAGDFDQEVLVELSEHAPRRCLTRGQLRSEVAACAAGLLASGVKKGRPGCGVDAKCSRSCGFGTWSLESRRGSKHRIDRFWSSSTY